jgi:hypothetical protein
MAADGQAGALETAAAGVSPRWRARVACHTMASGVGGGGGWTVRRCQHMCAHLTPTPFPAPPLTLSTLTHSHAGGRQQQDAVQHAPSSPPPPTEHTAHTAARRRSRRRQAVCPRRVVMQRWGDNARMQAGAMGERGREGGGRRVQQAWRHRLRTQPPCPRARLAVQASRPTAHGPAHSASLASRTGATWRSHACGHRATLPHTQRSARTTPARARAPRLTISHAAECGAAGTTHAHWDGTPLAGPSAVEAEIDGPSFPAPS